MAVEYEGGVIIGADSRTSTGYVLWNERLENSHVNVKQRICC